MKLIYVLMACTLGVGGISCGNQEEQREPGPVTEMDQTRYNLNSADKMHYGTADSLNQDSIVQDSLR